MRLIRSVLLSTFTMAIASPLAQAADADFLACEKIAAEQDRLGCFDDAVAKVKKQVAAGEAPAPAPIRAEADPQYFGVPIDMNPAPNAPISIYREEFMLLCDDLASVGVPVREDREQAWRDFAGWRVNYDQALVALCALVDAPATPWSSDRIERFHRPTIFRPRWRIDPLDMPSSW